MWERVTIADFYQEFVIIPVLLLVIALNAWGTRANRARAKKWAATHFPLLESEYAKVGFGGNGSTAEEMLREKSKAEFITHCTGRQNVAWLDIKLSLYPRYNPFKWVVEILASFFFDTMPAPVERVEATAYMFDGKER